MSVVVPVFFRLLRSNWAAKVLGVDIDEESVKNSRENADTNGVGDELILGVGSVVKYWKANLHSTKRRWWLRISLRR